MKKGVYNLLKRGFSNQSMLNDKKILISGSLGNNTPMDTIQFLKNNGAILDIMNINYDKMGRKQDMIQRLKGNKYHGIMVSLEDIVDKDVINMASESCRVISTMSVGYNHIDFELCRSLGIKIGYTPGILTETTADLVVALTLACSRQLMAANEAVYNGGWGMWEPLFYAGKDINNSVIGIVGMGRIGMAVAKRFCGFNCNILYTRNSGVKYPNESEFNGTLCDFDYLLNNSDFVIPLCPLNAQTKGLFGINEFKKMKNDAIFINASRGDVVNQKDLAYALNNDLILAAGIDVSTPEPLPLDDELLKIDKKKLTILPHIGSASIKTRNKMGIMAAQNIIDGLNDINSDTILKQ